MDCDPDCPELYAFDVFRKVQAPFDLEDSRLLPSRWAPPGPRRGVESADEAGRFH